MKKHKVELVQSFEGDWQTLYLDGEQFAEGHRIDNDYWMDLLKELGVTVEYQETEDGSIPKSTEIY